MTCGNVVKAQQLSPAEHCAELHILVALNAGVRGLAVYIAVGKGLHNVLCKIIGKIKGNVVDAYFSAHAPCVINIGKRTAAALGIALPQHGIIIEPEGAAAYLIALLFKNKCGSGAVNSPAHAHKDLFLIQIISSP